MDEAFVVAYTDGCQLVTVRGEIDGANANAFRLACTSTRPVVVDLLNCPYMDSSGLSALIACDRTGNTLLILTPTSRIYRIFEVTQLLKHFAVVSTLDEALALVSVPSRTEPLADAPDL